MPNLLTLHKIRQRIGKKRQSSYSNKLDEFHKAIRSLRISSPYIHSQMIRGGYNELSKIKEYKKNDGKIVIGFKGYVYRIILTHKLASDYIDKCKPVKNNPTRLNPRSYSGDKNSYHREFFKSIGIDIDSKTWIKLAKIIDFGTLFKGPRNFTFWTDSNLAIGDILKNSFKIGYATDWLEEYALILRCHTETIEDNLIHIPTVLDAFSEPIFLPVRENCSKIKNGLAVNIESSPLCCGFNEYVIGPIEIENIEFLPVRIGNIATKKIELQNNLQLWEKLTNFYNKL